MKEENLPVSDKEILPLSSPKSSALKFLLKSSGEKCTEQMTALLGLNPWSPLLHLVIQIFLLFVSRGNL